MEVQLGGAAVVAVLTQACSQTPALLKPAEHQLKLWETQPDFYTILQVTWSNFSLDTNVRWLAVLCFKNGVDRYWRKSAPNAIREEEKSLLRQRLLTFDEPVNQISTQLAVLTAKLARLDCPRDWPQLLPVLLDAVKSPQPLRQQRALLVMYHVIKALASKRLAGDRRLFAELAANLIGFLLFLWNAHMDTLERRLAALDACARPDPADHAQLLLAFDQSILVLKVLRRLVVFGVSDWKACEFAHTFVNTVFQRTEQFLKAKGQMELDKVELSPRRLKIINVLTKTLIDLQENHAEVFAPYIQPSLELAVRFNFTPEGADLVFDRFTVNTCNLMRAILRCEAYRTPKGLSPPRNGTQSEARRVINTLLPPATLTEICQRLILHYLPLTSDDLQNWNDDPEEFICEEVGDAWKYNLRPCINCLYLTLMKEFRDTLVPVVLTMMQQCQQTCHTADLASILKTDAVYNAMGQASFELYDDVNFDDWFVNDLRLKLKTEHANCRVLRRRVVWLVGCWIGVKLSVSLRPAVYECVLPLLQSAQDLVVRIEAAKTLKIAVDDFEFKTAVFLPYLDTSFSLLFQLLKDVTECETKMQVLHVISFVAERTQEAMRPHALPLVRFLHVLWLDSADHLMLRCAILATLAHLVQCMGEVGREANAVLLPLISESVSGVGETVCLLEDALDLWLVTLHATPAPAPGADAPLLALYPRLVTLLDLGADTLRIGLKIIEAYIMLYPEEMLRNYSSQLVAALRSLLTDLRTEGIVLVYKVAELLLQVFPQDVPSLLAEMLADVFQEIVEGQAAPMVTSLHLSLFARVVLSSPVFFQRFIGELATRLAHSVDDVMATFLDKWLEKSDCFVQVERKKLSVLALTSLLTLDTRAALQRFSAIINVAIEALHDVCQCGNDDDDDGTSQFCDSLLLDPSDATPVTNGDGTETPHDRRMKQVAYADPVHSTNLRTFVLEKLTLCQRQCGDAFNICMASLDPQLSKQLEHFMKP